MFQIYPAGLLEVRVQISGLCCRDFDMWLVRPAPITVMGERIGSLDVAGKEKQTSLKGLSE